MYSAEYWDCYLTEHYDLLKKMANNCFPGDRDTADEALSYVSEKLLEDDRRRLRLYDPDRGATPKTYFCTLARQLVREFLRTKSGRFIPPRWIADQKNPLWTLVYRCLCWERMPEADVIEYLRRSAPGGRDPALIEEAIAVIRHKYPDCGKARGAETSVSHDALPAANGSPEDQVMNCQWLRICRTILSSPGDDLNGGPTWAKIRAVKERLRQDFVPTAEERLFLRMVYQDGMRVSHAGRQLGWNKNQAAGRNRRLVSRLRRIIGDQLCLLTEAPPSSKGRGW